nr:hypothetical protein [Tanacetum cinerariifolium]
MDTTIEQPAAMDEALVPNAQSLRIGRRNLRLLSDIKSKESTLQLVYDVLRICPFFKAFLMDNKKRIMNLESFRDMLHICPRVHAHFDEPPFEEEIHAFIHFLRYSAAIKTLTDVNINKLYQPLRSFAAIINKCLTRKSSGYDSLRLSQAQILWGLYHKRNIDYAYLMWEDFFYQVENKNQKKSNEMYYPRFIKVIIYHFMSKDPSIPRRNKVNWHYVRDDYMFSTIKLELHHPSLRTRSSFDTSITPQTAAASPRLTASAKGKQTAKSSKSKSLSALFEVAMTKAQQLKLVTKRNMQQTHISQASGSGADKGTGSILEVPDAPTDEIEEELSWNSTDDEGADNEGKDGDDDEEDEGDDGGDDDEEFDEEEYAEETRDDESFDPILRTPENSDDEGNGDEDLGLNIGGEEGHVKEEEEDELYRDVNINQGRGIQATLEVEDSYVTLTPVNPDGMESIFETTSQMDVQTPTSVASLPITALTMNPSTIATITTTSQAPILPTTISSTIIQNLPNFGSLFHFDDRLRSLEANFSEFTQTNQFAEAVSAIPGIAVNEQLEAEVLTRSSHSSKTSYVVAADLSEMELKKILIEKMEGNKSAGRSTQGSRSRQASVSESALAEEPMPTTSQMEEPSLPKFDTGAKDQPIVQSYQHPEWFSQQQKPPSLDRAWNKTVDTLTPKLLAGPTYELMKGSCKSLVELEYHLEEVFKAKTDQLDWVNPEGQQYPHNLLKPLQLIPNNRGCRVIPFEHFINNDLEYLCGGASSRKYTTFITKMKATDYGHIKWIEGFMPRTMWIEEPMGYDKHALLGVFYWGRKRQQFYGFAVNQESARNVYSKRRIISVTELKIVEWHSYKHLDWITVRRDDDKLYKFKEGDLKRLCIQDIEDMLLLLVQGKLTNLTVKECFAFNVSLQMFTRSIIIQRRVEDLQLGVESYLKKLNLTKSDSYRSDLKHKEAYTAYSNLRGFIYQNKDKRNMLMQIDELHKFSDGTLTDVRTALDDHLKGIRMQYLPQSI